MVSLLTAASEHIFSSVVFKCPCNSKKTLYGASFLLAPAFVLFLLSFMVNPQTWCLLTGKCPPGKHLQCCSWGTCAHFHQGLLPISAKASVALLGANFYECAASASSLIERIYCKGWFLIASIMTVALISTCVRHYCSLVSYLQLKSWKIYSKKEHELLETKAKEHATKLVQRNTNCFYESTEPAPFHTPSNEDWKKISIIYTINSQEQYYSMLHKYVSTNRGNSPKSEEEGQDLTVLELVDEAQTNV